MAYRGGGRGRSPGGYQGTQDDWSRNKNNNYGAYGQAGDYIDRRNNTSVNFYPTNINFGYPARGYGGLDREDYRDRSGRREDYWDRSGRREDYRERSGHREYNECDRYDDENDDPYDYPYRYSRTQQEALPRYYENPQRREQSYQEDASTRELQSRRARSRSTVRHELSTSDYPSPAEGDPGPEQENNIDSQRQEQGNQPAQAISSVGQAAANGVASTLGKRTIREGSEEGEIIDLAADARLKRAKVSEPANESTQQAPPPDSQDDLSLTAGTTPLAVPPTPNGAVAPLGLGTVSMAGYGTVSVADINQFLSVFQGSIQGTTNGEVDLSLLTNLDGEQRKAVMRVSRSIHASSNRAEFIRKHGDITPQEPLIANRKKDPVGGAIWAWFAENVRDDSLPDDDPNIATTTNARALLKGRPFVPIHQDHAAGTLTCYRVSTYGGTSTPPWTALYSDLLYLSNESSNKRDTPLPIGTIGLTPTKEAQDEYLGTSSLGLVDRKTVVHINMRDPIVYLGHINTDDLPKIVNTARHKDLAAELTNVYNSRKQQEMLKSDDAGNTTTQRAA